MKSIDLSRRELMVAAGGIAITGLAWPIGVLGQEPDPLGKDLIFPDDRSPQRRARAGQAGAILDHSSQTLLRQISRTQS